MILLLQEADEMRQAYQIALQAFSSQVVWLRTLETLLSIVCKKPPLTIIVDLDLLNWSKTNNSPLEIIRTTFPKSDLIALSSKDSANLALSCLRAGFTDFLLKPMSPEELAWGVRKGQKHRKLLNKLKDPKAALVSAATQISACTNPTMVRLSTLEFLRTGLRCEGAAWLKSEGRSQRFLVVCSLPKEEHSAKILWRLPEGRVGKRSSVIRNRARRKRKFLLPCHNSEWGVIFLWGIPTKIAAEKRTDARLLLRHSEMTLFNLTKFEEIKQQTFVDELTGLYNSRYLKFAFASAVAKCNTPKECFAVLFIDVDHFKSVNDSHGHLIGSEFLIAISRTIKNAVRRIDPVFRYGGDEFVVILQNTPLGKARKIAERIRKHVEQRVFAIQQARIQTTVSIGLAVYPETASTLDSLLRLADLAMYAVKKDSRNAVKLAGEMKHASDYRR